MGRMSTAAVALLVASLPAAIAAADDPAPPAAPVVAPTSADELARALAGTPGDARSKAEAALADASPETLRAVVLSLASLARRAPAVERIVAPDAPTITAPPELPAPSAPGLSLALPAPAHDEPPDLDPFLRRPIPPVGGLPADPAARGLQFEVRHLLFAAEVATRWFGDAERGGGCALVSASDAEVETLLAGIVHGPGPLYTGGGEVTAYEGQHVFVMQSAEVVPAAMGAAVGENAGAGGAAAASFGDGLHVGVSGRIAPDGRIRLQVDARAGWIVPSRSWECSLPCDGSERVLASATYAARNAHLSTLLRSGGSVLVGPLGTTAKGGVRASLLTVRSVAMAADSQKTDAPAKTEPKKPDAPAK